ncbi:DUF308 domain-containing protein [Devosia sp.]|uniref:HdeD family acid-resistance protein n=1 Tax=Devosia sp. TaxID=1871048 RepID=UPI0032665981
MAVSAEFKRRFAAATALRGVLMLLAGLYVVIWPASALTSLVVLGGALLMIDGALGLWSLTFGGGKSGNYWFDVASNALSLILGVLILISPLIATILTVTLLSTIVGIAALAVGIMQISVVIRERALYAHIWPVILSGVSYVLIGLVFLFFPITSSSVMVVFGGVMLIVFSFGLFGWAWKLYQRSKAA